MGGCASHSTSPLHTSGARRWSRAHCYRIYADRIELDFRFVVRKTFELRPADVDDIWVGRPPAVGELWRGRHPVAGFGLKFDWADLFDHVVILRTKRLGFPRALHFTPEGPHAFVVAAQVALKR